MEELHPMVRDLRPHRSLVHPLWLGALALLVLNDHLLKGGGLLPGWLTGKLSDFAGLLVAPAVLATLLGVASRRGLLAAHAAVCAGFSLINLFPGIARAVEALTAPTPFPWRITVDPTDLIALPMLVVSYRVLGASMRRPAHVAAFARRASLMAGSLASVATSYVDPCQETGECGGPPIPSQGDASLLLGNTTESEQFVRLRHLRDSVQIERCEALLQDPTRALSRELFGPAELWQVGPGQAIPLQNAGCDAYLIDGDGLAMTLLAWSSAQFPTRFMPISTEAAPPDAVISLQRDGARLRLAQHPAVFDAPPALPPAPEDACGAKDASRIDWTEPPPGAHVITAVTSSPDGCHALDLADAQQLYVCIPGVPLPFQVGDAVEATAVALSDGTYPELQNAAASGRGLYLQSATHALFALQGNVVARWSMSPRVEPPADPSAKAEALSGCGGFHDACGSFVEPIEVSLLGDGVPEITSLRAGQSTELAVGYGTLHLIRAEDMPVRDAQCFTAGPGARVIESVLIAALAAR
jgi:hypothetical protein